jgi:flagellar biosynthesis anti-sigma factor FlgM
MEIPEIKNKAIQNKIQVASKAPAAKGGSSGASSTSSSAQGTDKTAFSAEAVAIQNAISSVKEGPSLSQSEKVARLKQDYQNGRLEVDPHKVAEKLLTDIITESISLGS